MLWCPRVCMLLCQARRLWEGRGVGGFGQTPHQKTLVQAIVPLAKIN